MICSCPVSGRIYDGNHHPPSWTNRQRPQTGVCAPNIGRDSRINLDCQVETALKRQFPLQPISRLARVASGNSRIRPALRAIRP